MFRNSRRTTLVCTALAGVLLVWLSTACERTTTDTTSTSFDGWADSFIQDWLDDAPQLATATQFFSGTQQDNLDRRLSLVSESGQTYGVDAASARASLARRGREELERLPAAVFTPQQRTSVALLRWALDDTIASADFATHRYVFDQFNGLQLDLVNHLTQSHPIRQRRDIENYLARLARVPETVDDGIREAKAAATAGVVPPRFILERTIEQIDAFLNADVRENVFVSTLDARIAAMSDPVRQAERGAFVAAAEKITIEAVIPAYRRIKELLAASCRRRRTTRASGDYRAELSSMRRHCAPTPRPI